MAALPFLGLLLLMVAAVGWLKTTEDPEDRCVGCKKLLPPWRSFFCSAECIERWQREHGANPESMLR